MLKGAETILTQFIRMVSAPFSKVFFEINYNFLREIKASALVCHNVEHHFVGHSHSVSAY